MDQNPPPPASPAPGDADRKRVAVDLPLVLTITGWVGALFTLTAYALLSAGRLSPQSRAFQGANIGGSTLLCMSALMNEAWPSATVNAVWVLIGAQAWFMLIRAQKLRAVEDTARAAEEAQIAARLAAEARAFELAPTMMLPIIELDERGNIADARLVAAR